MALPDWIKQIFTPGNVAVSNKTRDAALVNVRNEKNYTVNINLNLQSLPTEVANRFDPSSMTPEIRREVEKLTTERLTQLQTALEVLPEKRAESSLQTSSRQAISITSRNCDF